MVSPLSFAQEHSLKTMVVDDDPGARAIMLDLLGQMPTVQVCAVACNVREAIEQLKEIAVDAMFLDVNMPDATGLALARALQTLQSPPAIVFASAHPEYAIHAFELNAVDYLVKPIDYGRLEQAVTRVAEHVSWQALTRKNRRIPVDDGGKKHFVRLNDIRLVTAHDDYAYLQTDSDRYFVMSSLRTLEKSLGGYGFFRVHRSFLVNLDRIEEVEPFSGGRLMLTVDGIREKVPVSRRRAPELKSALGV